MPISARISRTFLTSASGAVEPTLRLMLNPSGSQPIENLGAELPQRFGRHLVGGTVGAIDDDAQPVERHVPGQRHLGEFDVAGHHVVDALRAAERVGTSRA